jgi:Ca2+-binding EF-hand superfamily protein
MGATESKLDDSVYESIGKYTELTKNDISAWQERFTQQCDPGSTTMNKEQFCKFYQECRPTENVKRLSENVFRAFDLDGDHGISFSEVNLCSNLSSKSNESFLNSISSKDIIYLNPSCSVIIIKAKY